MSHAFLGTSPKTVDKIMVFQLSTKYALFDFAYTLVGWPTVFDDRFSHVGLFGHL